jgi:hypothetical protein
VTPVRAVGTAGVSARWRRDNRPDFPGIAVWVDAIVSVGDEAEIDTEVGTRGYEGCETADGSGVDGRGAYGARTDAAEDDGEPVPWVVDAWSPEYAKVWRPLSGSGREPRPGLLLSVVRAGSVIAYPTPLADPPAGAMARALARLDRSAPVVPERRAEVLAVDAEPVPPEPRAATPQKSYSEVRALVGMLVEVLVGHRAAAHAASWTDPEVRGKLRKPCYARTATLKSVRLAESGAGVEALALLRDGGRTHAVALRFDRAEDARWRCTALQAG